LAKLKIACYSDIHHHEYTNGVTGQDVADVEAAFTDLCVKENVDIWVFGGDRFLSRNPLDVSRKNADTALRQRAEMNPQYQPGIMLVGNHDRWTKSQYSGHNLYVVGLHEIPGVTVLEKLSTHTEHVNGCTITFTAIPAGHKVSPPGIVPDPKADFNICLFHDITKGCKFTNGIVAPEGVDIGLLDVRGFDLVLGGDNHQRQDLGFKNTIGLYIGAPLWHNWGDLGSERGFLIVELETGKTPVYRWVESKAPKFIKEEHRISNDSDFPGILSAVGTRWTNNIVRLTLSGPPTALNGIQVPKLQEKFTKATGARQVKINTKYDEQEIQVPETGPIARDDGEEWKNFLNFKKSEFAGMDIDKIEKMGLDIIVEADNA
jgi:DNA repair exonuclease SbcCD nuclease subunit